MPISLILTPFDHFHFRPTSGLLSSQDLTYCHMRKEAIPGCITNGLAGRTYGETTELDHHIGTPGPGSL